MSDTDRILAAGLRILDDGCSSCAHSKVYCRAVTYIDGPAERCCPSCSH